MHKETLSASFETTNATYARNTAKRLNTSISAYLESLVEKQRLLELARETISEWEKEHGEITETMMDESRKKWLE